MHEKKESKTELREWPLKPYSLHHIHQKIESWDEKESIFKLEESENAIEEMNIRETTMQ